MQGSLKEKLMQALQKRAGVDAGRLESALASAKRSGRPLGQLLVEQGVVEEEHLTGLLAQQLQLPAIRLSRCKIDPALAELIPEKLARRHRIVPFSRMGECLSVAMADPLDVLALDDLAQLTGLRIDPAVAPPEEVEAALHQLYQGASEALEALISKSETEGATESKRADFLEEETVDLTAFGLSGRKAPIVKVADLMIVDALKARASDIHIEPYDNRIRVRYRVDGTLIEAFQLPKRAQNGMLTRLRIMSRLDITESRVPQDGRFKARVDGREIDFRVSVLPVRFGGKVVLRILDKSQLAAGLETLGFLPQSLEAFQKAVHRPYGMILVTGPTGSGKSTTLYSILSQINEPGRNILTIEDPVEYQIGGITQLQVRPEIGLSFASALRAFLRQAPDVVLVGEIRDQETADIATKAALTGQLVLSTLHTNDAVSAIFRLKDMGVDPFLMASSLAFVGAQRLCRRLCDACKAPQPVSPARLKEIGFPPFAGKEILYGPAGCPRCRQTGFKGRFAIIEALTVDDRVQEMIITRQGAEAIRAHARRSGMRTLLEEGWEHVRAGRTSLDELLRVTTEED